MIIPNVLSIKRSKDQTAEEVLENSSYRDMGFNLVEYELEGYRDATVGTVVFNRTILPQNKSQENDIFSKKQKIEYKKFNLIQNTRNLIKEEIVQKMYPSK